MKIFKTHSDQSGLVSIMIASVLMVIMALITLGFTRLVSNEQRQSIDDQLSKQAFYAAESGINLVAETYDFAGTNTAKTGCDVGAFNNGVVVEGNNDLAVTCVLIDPNPPSIVFDNDSIVSDKSKVIPIKTNRDASSVTFSWRDNNSDSTAVNCTDFSTNTSADEWTNIALLKLDLVRIPTVAFGREDLINNQFSAIFLPCATGGSMIAFDAAKLPGNTGRIVPVTCNSSPTIDYECSIQITGVDSSNMYARFNSIYGGINVRITATDNLAQQTLFSNVQAVVDSTGRSGDVFRRLQARVPLYNSFNYPNAALQTLEEVCKLYTVQAASVVDGC